MVKYEKLLLYIGLGLIFCIFILVNHDYDFCRVDDDTRAMFLEMEDCQTLDGAIFECLKTNKTRVNLYCEETYGGKWRWEKK